MDAIQYIKFALALVFVLSMIWLLALGLRRWQEKGGTLFKGGARRLHIVEVMPLDTRRRAVLIRRDGREHLLLLGGGNDLVIERDIQPLPTVNPTTEITA
jgi:flagellar protein FliO/FliZ